MLLLKGFFRKTSTKIYFAILSIILTTIIILFSFVNYYKGLLNNVFEDTTNIILITQNNYYDKFKNHKKVTKVEEAILLLPDYSYKVLGKQGFEIWANGEIIGSRESEHTIKMTWDEFITPYINYIMVFKNKDLKDKEISLGIDQIIDYDVPTENIIDQKIGFDINNNKKEFKIHSVYKSRFQEMTISENDFNELHGYNKLIGYRITLNNYKAAERLIKKIEKSENDSKFKITLNTVEYNGTKSMQSLKNIVQILSAISYIIIIVFSLIFILVIKNTIIDETKNIKIERLLGFNKNHIMKYLLLKILLLKITACFCSMIISKLLSDWINSRWNFNLNILSYYSVISYNFLFLFSLLYSLSFAIKTNKYIKNVN